MLSPSRQESAGSLPFITLPGASLTSASPVDFGQVVGTFLPLYVHEWDYPQADRSFINHSGCVRLGDLTLLATLGSAIHGVVEQKCEAQMVLPYVAGINTFTIERQTFTFRSSCLFIPAAQTQIRLDCSQCSGVIISFAPDCLFPVANAIAGPGFDPFLLRAAVQQTAILSRKNDDRRQRLHELLMQTMAYAERCIAMGGTIHPMLQLDDLIRRLIVMLLLPDLLEPAAAPPLISERFVHQDLIDWLLAHLHEPISLSCIEARSHYSRRSLQYAFKQRFGCGPMQWLRRQRLARARAMLMQASQPMAMKQVAQACGYLSQASFSRDFQERYGERPSRLLRRSLGGRSASP